MKYQAHVITLLLTGLLFFTACSDDDDTPEVLPPAPSITFADDGATSAEPGDTVAITVNARAESGIASLTVNGDDITGDTQGKTTDDIEYPYVVPADATPGDVSFTFVLTDEDERTAEEVYTVEVTAPVAENEVVSVSENITEDFTMETGTTYLLTDDVTVEAGATLTIQEGVTVLGQYVEEDLDSDDVNKTRYRLTIDAGAVIDAQGTAENPIVMTSERALDGEAEAGDWMGLRINGQEGSSSGTLEYVRIEYGGAQLPGGDTEPALRLQEVDQATTIDYLQVFRSVDQGVRTRGGSVDMRHLMLTECRNSSLLLDDQDGIAYSGNVQYMIVQSSNFAEKDGRDLEIRDDAEVNLANMTMIGSGLDIAEGDLNAIRIRSSAGGLRIYNSIIAEYSGDAVRADDPGQITGIDGEFVLAYSYLFNIGDDVTRDDPDDDDPTTPLPFEAEAETYFNTISAEETPTDAAGIGVADYSPDAAIASEYNSSELGDFFTEASFIGAVGDENWTSGWSVNAEGAVNP